MGRIPFTKPFRSLRAGMPAVVPQRIQKHRDMDCGSTVWSLCRGALLPASSLRSGSRNWCSGTSRNEHWPSSRASTVFRDAWCSFLNRLSFQCSTTMYRAERLGKSDPDAQSRANHRTQETTSVRKGRASRSAQAGTLRSQRDIHTRQLHSQDDETSLKLLSFSLLPSWQHNRPGTTLRPLTP